LAQASSTRSLPAAAAAMSAAVVGHCCIGRSGWLETEWVTAPGSVSVFAGFRFPREVISVAVRWYLRYGLSCRDVEELLAERGEPPRVRWRLRCFGFRNDYSMALAD
jgi:hypothetical protein